MEWLSALVTQLSKLSTLFMSAEEELFYVYLLTGIPLTVVAYTLHHKGSGPFSLRDCVSLVVPRQTLSHVSGRLDARFYVFNFFFFNMLFAATAAYIPDIAALSRECVTYLMGLIRATEQGSHVLLDMAFTVILFLAVDLAFFLVHRAFHRIPLLWNFHKVHHSAEILTPITAYRSHPLNVLANNLLILIFAGVVTGAFAAISRGQAREISLFGAGAVLFLTNLAGGFLRHSNVWLHYGAYLNRIFHSPAHHQIHHSSDPRHWDKNYGGTLALWDWIAGTLYVPGAREPLRFGLGNQEEMARYNSIPALYLVPFVDLTRGLRSRVRERVAAWK
jgi:sterol desaturase/sphingolipid hydroxylase (fatty acid hydroxylase superfamily)